MSSGYGGAGGGNVSVFFLLFFNAGLVSSTSKQVSIRAIWAVACRGRPSSRGKNLSNAKLAHFAQGHAHERPELEPIGQHWIVVDSISRGQCSTDFLKPSEG
jgi:hypothetical protein